MAHGNPQLQARAGKNYFGFLGIFDGQITEAFVSKVTEFTILEGQKDRDTIPGGVSLGPSTDLFTFVNKTGGDITAELYWRDKYGSEAKVDTDSLIPNDGTGSLNAGEILVQEGDTLIVRITAGNPAAGGGLLCIRSATQVGRSYLVSTYNDRLASGGSIDIESPEGAMFLGTAVAMFNSSPNDVTYTLELLDENDNVLDSQNGSVLAGETLFVTGGPCSTTLRNRLTIGPVVGGNLYVKAAGLFASNEFPAHPEL